jgi:rare lipoprotein A
MKYLQPFCLALAWSVATAEPIPPPPVKRETPAHSRASWYGPKYHGRLTASGEVFDMTKLTAAHRDLPFGARLKVTEPRSGRSVTVRVNDRGPFVPGIDLDLSWAAARGLGIERQGLAKVQYERLHD